MGWIMIGRFVPVDFKHLQSDLIKMNTLVMGLLYHDYVADTKDPRPWISVAKYL